MTITRINPDYSAVQTWSDAANGVYASKIGKLVVINLMPNGARTVGDGATYITTLPSGWRPTRQLAAACEGGGYCVQILADPGGNFSIYKGGGFSGSKNLWLRGTITYTTA